MRRDGTAVDAAAGGATASPRPFPATLSALTSIRFILALGVVLFHYHLQWPYQDTEVTGVFERARLGVDAFFILSGFILTHVYDRELVEGRFRYRRFLLARVARIFPLHLAAVAMVVLMVLGARAMGASYDPEGYSLYGLGLTLLLMQAWFPIDTTMHWVGPSWSLSAEWFGYLLFPVFAWAGLRWRERPWILLVLAAALFIGLDALYRELTGRILPHAEHYFGTMRLVPEFLYGIALYRIGQQVSLPRRSTIMAALVSAAIVLVMMHLHVDDRFIVVAIGPMILSLALLSKAGADKLAGARPLTFLGEASFALYLVHMPVLITWKNIVAQTRGVSSDYVMGLPELSALFSLTLLIACSAHLAIEAPARSYLRRALDRRAADPVSPTVSAVR